MKGQLGTVWEGSDPYPFNWDELLSVLVSIMTMSEWEKCQAPSNLLYFHYYIFII